MGRRSGWLWEVSCWLGLVCGCAADGGEKKANEYGGKKDQRSIPLFRYSSGAFPYFLRKARVK